MNRFLDSVYNDNFWGRRDTDSNRQLRPNWEGARLSFNEHHNIRVLTQYMELPRACCLGLCVRNLLIKIQVPSSVNAHISPPPVIYRAPSHRVRGTKFPLCCFNHNGVLFRSTMTVDLRHCIGIIWAKILLNFVQFEWWS